jgi:eukaryotic-like serine/threonine-protein kinase
VRRRIRPPSTTEQRYKIHETVDQPHRGSRVGAYELLSPVAAGGMGEVWKARDTRVDRTVAIKFSKAGFGERFHHESRAIAALNHPHICQLYDVGPNYLVLEFVEGQPLRGPIPLSTALEYSAQILDALHAAHNKGIVHRDLKPANILVTKHQVKLLDFGLAKHVPNMPVGESTVTSALTAEGQIVGTLQYMSPEQLQGKAADARSDFFAFGCVLYEMISGKPAFSGTTPASVIASILEREPVPLSLPAPLDRIIRTCLAKDPDERFQNALDLKRALLWTTDQGQPSERTHFLSARVIAAALALLAAVVFIATRLWIRPAADQPLIRADLDIGVEFSQPAISPDGTMVAFIAKDELAIRRLSESNFTPLAGTSGASSPFFSSDGESIGFFATGN